MIFFSIKSFFKKIIVIGLLPVWWCLTLSNTYQHPTHSSLYLDIKDSWQLDIQTQGFSTIESSLFKKACQGSLEVIETFIQQWVKEKGFSFEEREIMYHMLDLLQGSYPLDAKIDGIERKYLPQTYVSAVFLLTMLPSQEIIAIPEGIKRRFDLYGSKIHDITLTTDRRNFESIYLNNPCKAFTAFYTNPDIKRTLTLQGIPYVDIDKINTVEEIEEAIVDVGYHMDKPQTAFVIANFFKIAFKAIDLRIEAFYSDKELIPKRILLVEAFQSYTLPTKKSLSFQLLDRIKTSKVQVLKRSLLLQSRTWSEPINNENILQMNPDLIISIGVRTFGKLINDPVLRRSKAVKTQNIIVLDEHINHAPDQFLSMAYLQMAVSLVNSFSSEYYDKI